MKTKMPEPVAYFIVDSGTGAFHEVHPDYKEDDDVFGVYGDLQMEAYANARVREALEEAVDLAMNAHPDTPPTWIAAFISNMIPKETT